MSKNEAQFTLEGNKEYWNSPDVVSIIDSNLKELEIQFIQKFLKPEFVIADIGCYDGYATRRFAEKVKYCFGIERSQNLLMKARADAKESGVKNIEFKAGDILEFSGFDNPLDAVVTERVIINLPSWQLQQKAIDNVHRALRKGGIYVMVENTHDGDDILNRYRGAVGLPPIPRHWHNFFLDYPEFLRFIKGKFEVVERTGFSLYYLLTRVYVQMFASFTGSGKNAKADPIFKKSDEAARRLHEAIGHLVEFKENEVLGPIQGIALRKVAD